MVTSVARPWQEAHMLTYTFSSGDGIPLYEQLTNFIKKDISDGTIAAGDKLPSKRTFAKHLGISTITIETAYQQLIAEGYITSVPKKGYFVSDILREFLSIPGADEKNIHTDLPSSVEPLRKSWLTDFSGNESDPDTFPFLIWAKLTREILAGEKDRLLTTSPGIGIQPLREAIASHLNAFRGMSVDPDHIVIGAGTEYLYGLLIQLLGFQSKYAVEDPGHRKIPMIYEQHGIRFSYLPLEEDRNIPEILQKKNVDILHISPSHHFPTGRVMPIRLRLSLLAWAKDKEERYIIEDDYDSEFRLVGQPIPSLQAIDPAGKVIYMNTFTKTLSSTIRISYMILPPKLMQRFREQLSFYSCTVSNFEQYTLAAFLSRGFFEKHLNRMRTYYHNKRDRIMKALLESPLAPVIHISEENAGLHFLMTIRTELSDDTLTKLCEEKGIRIMPLSSFYHDVRKANPHVFLVNYSSLSEEHLEDSIRIMAELLKSGEDN